MKKINRRQWAEFRFQVVGQLLAAPPTEYGELRREIDKLAERSWPHPVTKVPTQVSASTIERWLRKARRARTDTVFAPSGTLTRGRDPWSSQCRKPSSQLSASLHRFRHSSASYA